MLLVLIVLVNSTMITIPMMEIISLEMMMATMTMKIMVQMR